MSIPLPNDVRKVIGENARQITNASLLLDKYCEHKHWPDQSDVSASERSLKRVAQLLGRGNRQMDEVRQLRRKATDTLARQFLKSGYATEVVATTAARLAIGLSDGMIQNGGITLDRLTGLPTLRASAIKGVTRNAALWRIRNSENSDEKATLTALFLKAFGYLASEVEQGSTLATQLEATIPPGFSGDIAGMVTFLPAFPLENANLEIDLTNVHTPDYYTRTNRAGDPALLKIEKPLPNFFPTIATGARFSFLLALTPRGKALGETEAKELLDYARDALVTALSVHGIGAKTASGYGWFHINEEIAEARSSQRDKELEEAIKSQTRAELEPDAALYETFEKMNEQNLRALVNPFQYEKRAWKTSGPESEETYRLSVLTYLTEKKTDLYQAEKSNPKSKFIKGLNGLAQHFSRQLP